MMKRLASLFKTTALVGALVAPGLAARAGNIYNLYLVPVSPLNAFYQNGDTIQFAALVDIPVGAGAVTLSLGAAVNYDINVFDINTITAVADSSAYPPKPSVALWNLVAPPAYSATSDGVDTFQLGVGHLRQTLPPGGKTTTIPPGTYTLGTFFFRVIATPNGYGATTVISLPTAYGKTGTNSAIDFINSVDSAGTNLSALAFPNSGGKYSQLTYRIGPPSVTIYYGAFNFEGIAAYSPAQNITFTFRPKNGHAPFTYTYATATTGYGFELPTQPYIIHIKGDKYLAANVDTDLGTVTQEGVQLPPVTLLAGDGNNDNAVDAADFGLLVNAYLSSRSDPMSAYDIRADFNNDGVVDIADFSLLVANYGAMGDL